MLILGLDFETTGFDFQNDRITEVGAVLWDTVTSTPVRLVSTLVKHTDAPPISPEITRLTGIDQALLDAHGYPLAEILHSARQPIATCVAEGQGENAEAPRKRGYRWLHGRWLKFLREQQAQSEVAEAGFPVTLEPFNAEQA